MAPQPGEDRAYDAVLRVEDKLTDFTERVEEGNREIRTLISEISIRQAVLEDRQRRTESDVTLAAAEANKAHQRIDTIANARAEDVGMRKGMVAGITLASALGGGGIVGAIGAAMGAFS